MTLAEALIEISGLQKMLGQPCKKCKGLIIKVIPLPISDGHGQAQNEFFIQFSGFDFVNSRAELKDKQYNGLDWGIYVVCKSDNNNLCYEPLSIHDQITPNSD